MVIGNTKALFNANFIGETSFKRWVMQYFDNINDSLKLIWSIMLVVKFDHWKTIYK